MAGNDDDKTVFGQSLPSTSGQKNTEKKPPVAPLATPPQPLPTPPPPAAQPPQPQPQGGDKTVFGVQLPQSNSPPPARVAPTGTPLPHAPINQPPPPGTDDTWLGGALNPQGTPPQQSYQPPQPPLQQPQYKQPLYQPQNVYPAGAGADMFPDIPTPEAQPQQAIVPQIALADALRGTGMDKGGSTNPLIALASNLLILLGRLRSGMVEMQVAPLIDHVAREIDLFERNAHQAGIPQQDVLDAKYALSATADDIVQNLPGADKGIWIQYSMVARFFGERSAGVVFFQKMDEAMKAPGQRFNLLELMLTCLSLGFEGQYRVIPNGMVELARIRNAIYETLRRVQPRPDDDISVRWAGVPLGRKRNYGGTPVWIVAAVAGLMVVALFATLSTLIAKQGTMVRGNIMALHSNLPEITIERTVPVEVPYVAPVSNQLERIRNQLAAEITDGSVTIEPLNEYIFVRVGAVLRFRSGSSDLESDFSGLAARIAEVVNGETGPVKVVGYTDSIPLSGRGRYKSNEALSLSRAETVRDALAALITDPSRLEAIGRGPVDPIADNGTREGRAQNRRVEVRIAREGSN